jgi:hypothetical protein
MGAGRPLKFKSVKELEQKIKAYFDSCHDEEGKIIKPLTITGLALALDTSRETLMNYEGREEFFDAIKRAKLKVENYAEEQLFIKQSPTGPIFALKNFGWDDKQQTEHSGMMTVNWPLGKSKLDE